MSWEDVPGRLGKWLERYPLEVAKGAQVMGLKKFFQAIYGVDFKELRGGHGKKPDQLRKEQLIQINDYIEQYINEHEERNFTEDLITLVKWINDHPKPYSYKSAGIVYAMVKKFFSRQPENRVDHRYTVAEMDDDDIRRTLVPKRGETLRDDKPTKAQLRSILEHLSIQHKAFALVGASTGLRPVTIKRILLEDMDLEADPPFAKLIQKRGGKQVPPQVWFSYEARDAINEWLKLIRTEGKEEPKIRKKTGGKYDPNTPLNVSYHGAWVSALKKAGLDKIDEIPRRRQYIYHFYTLRKFFYTNMKNDGMNLDVVNALMGHEAYLADAYDRTGVEELAKIYLEHMDAVQIYVKDQENIRKQINIKPEDIDAHQELGWEWNRGQLPDGRITLDWRGDGKPRYPTGEQK